MSLVLTIILGLAGSSFSLDGNDSVHCRGRRAIVQSVGPDLVRDAWCERLAPQRDDSQTYGRSRDAHKARRSRRRLLAPTAGSAMLHLRFVATTLASANPPRVPAPRSLRGRT